MVLSNNMPHVIKELESIGSLNIKENTQWPEPESKPYKKLYKKYFHVWYWKFKISTRMIFFNIQR